MRINSNRRGQPLNQDPGDVKAPVKKKVPVSSIMDDLDDLDGL